MIRGVDFLVGFYFSLLVTEIGSRFVHPHAAGWFAICFPAAGLALFGGIAFHRRFEIRSRRTAPPEQLKRVA